MIQRQWVYWALMPEEKRRPVLVLSPNIRNERANDVIVVPLSTVMRAGPWHVRLKKGEGGLSKPSVVKCEHITTLPKVFISPEPIGGPLTTRRMADVERAVLRAIGVPIE